MPGFVQATFLLPDARVFGAQRWEAGLLRRLGQGDAIRQAAGRTAQWQRHFALPGMTGAWPFAALSRQAECGDAGQALWLRADPAWLRADINGVRLLAVGESLALLAEEAAALAEALQPIFAAAGMVLDWPLPGRAWLRLPEGTVLPQFADPEDALGDDVFEHTDTRAQARHWRTLSAEVQMQLHAHPLNQARAARGLAPVNALWFWGGGRLPTQPVTTLQSRVCSADSRLQALARAASVAAELPARFACPADAALFDLVHVRDLRVLQDEWLQPALAALDAGSLHGLVLEDEAGNGLHLRRWQRLRFWRKPWQWPSPLAMADGEAVA